MERKTLFSFWKGNLKLGNFEHVKELCQILQYAIISFSFSFFFVREFSTFFFLLPFSISYIFQTPYGLCVFVCQPIPNLKEIFVKLKWFQHNFDRFCNNDMPWEWCTNHNLSVYCENLEQKKKRKEKSFVRMPPCI